MIDLIFNEFSYVGDIIVLQNCNVDAPPFECNFSNFKDALNKYPFSIFDNGDAVII